MNSQPEISVVVPMYNVADYIEECLGSVQHQTFTDFEVLCIDDGSTDDTLVRAQACVAGDARFKFIQKENGGQSSARNLGIDCAQGTYLLFLDSDDYYLPHTLERLHDVAMRDELDYLDFTAHTFYETERARELNDESYYENRPSIPGVMTGPELFVQYQRHVEYHCSPCFHFIRRGLLADSGLRFKEGVIHEDELFSPLLIAQAKRAAYLNEALYRRRMREGSTMTTRQGLRSAVCMLDASESLERWLRDNWQRYDAEFTDAVAQRVRELRGLAVGYARKASQDDLARYAASVQGDALIDFDLVLVGGLEEGRAEFAQSGCVAGAAARATRVACSVGRAGRDAIVSRLGRGERAVGPGADAADGDAASIAAPHMTAPPCVSVIIPAYNARAHVRQCVESVLGQTFPDFEVLCVDDGSTDETPVLLSELADLDGRIRVIRQANAGPGCARNAGLAQARGRFVYCLDSDDYLESDMLQRCVAALGETGADMVLFAFRTYNQHAHRAFPAPWGMPFIDELPSYPEGTFSWHTAPDIFFHAMQNVPWNKMVRRSVLMDNDITFQDIHLTEDLMYSLPAAICSTSIVRITRPLMCHREFEGVNLMSRKDRHPVDFLAAFRALRGWLCARGIYDDLRVAWQTWLMNAVYYNMPTYESYEAFTEAYDELAKDGLRAYDLADLQSADIRHPHHRRLHEALLTGSRERFLLACANCGFESAADEKRMLQLEETRFTVARNEMLEGMRTGEGAVRDVARALKGFTQCNQP